MLRKVLTREPSGCNNYHQIVGLNFVRKENFILSFKTFFLFFLETLIVSWR